MVVTWCIVAVFVQCYNFLTYSRSAKQQVLVTFQRSFVQPTLDSVQGLEAFKTWLGVLWQTVDFGTNSCKINKHSFIISDFNNSTTGCKCRKKKKIH